MFPGADMAAVIEAIRLALVKREAVLNPPATDEAIREVETRLAVRLPDALRQLYRMFNGTAKMSKDMWQIWPLDGLETRKFSSFPADDASPGPRGRHLVFCDALIWLPAFAVCIDPPLSEQTEVWALSDWEQGLGIHRCTPSLERFLEMLPGQMDDHFMDVIEW